MQQIDRVNDQGQWVIMKPLLNLMENSNNSLLIILRGKRQAYIDADVRILNQCYTGRTPASIYILHLTTTIPVHYMRHEMLCRILKIR
jgi:hypothetical protein